MLIITKVFALSVLETLKSTIKSAGCLATDGISFTQSVLCFGSSSKLRVLYVRKKSTIRFLSNKGSRQIER